MSLHLDASPKIHALMGGCEITHHEYVVFLRMEMSVLHAIHILVISPH